MLPHEQEKELFLFVCCKCVFTGGDRLSHLRPGLSLGGMAVSKEVLGVIGGLGPLATAHFLELVARMTAAKLDQQHLDMIVYNFPSIPDRTGYLLGSNLKSPLPGLLWAGRALAREKVRCIAIPSITAHFFYEELTEDLRIPILDGVEETVKELHDHHITKAGIMATDATLISGFFTKALMDAGIQPVLPSKPRQQDVMHLIYDNIKAGKQAELDRFQKVCDELRQKGAEVIILGCTELSLIKKEYALGPGFLDAMEVLARQSVLCCGKRVKPQYDNLIS